jgi:hypothetical protein
MVQHAWRKRWVRWLLVVGVGVGYVLALRQWVDPRPPTPPTLRQPLASPITIPANQRWASWLEPFEPATAPRAVQLTAAYQQGEQDMVYGWLWGTAEAHLAFGISPLGYIVLEQVTAEGRTLILPLQTYPHVRGGTAENTLGLELTADQQVVIRLNGEWVWQGPAPAGGQLGLWGESWGETAVIRFTLVEKWD